METVTCICKTLRASTELTNSLKATSEGEQVRSGSVLFRAGDKNVGIFVVLRGSVCLQVPDAPELDRVFSSGSLLGLPSTFTGKPYCLTGVAVADSEVAHIPREDFLNLMVTRPELCQEAAELLSCEVAFILSALRNDRGPCEPQSVSESQTTR